VSEIKLKFTNGMQVRFIEPATNYGEPVEPWRGARPEKGDYGVVEAVGGGRLIGVRVEGQQRYFAVDKTCVKPLDKSGLPEKKAKTIKMGDNQ
jgi:hypothetical protein